MPIVVIRDIEDPRLAEYRWVASPDTLVRQGRFVAEGRFVVQRLLESTRFRVRSLLLTPTLWGNFGTQLDPSLLETTPIYVVARETMQALTGVEFHRGCLAIGERRDACSASDFFRMLDGVPSCIAVLEDIINPDNMGGIFRNAQAFGAAAILLSPHCVDPLYRKAIRVSMGAALQVPFFRIEDWGKIFDLLAENRFCSVALTPSPSALPIARVADHFFEAASGQAGRITPKRDEWQSADHSQAAGNAMSGNPATHGARQPDLPQRFALFLGAEGTGLTDTVLDQVQIQVRIPIRPEVDSLNVATASGIALHHFMQLLPNEAAHELS